jgi:peptidoglycan/LPS O-acetylase OafA/YrhL
MLGTVRFVLASLVVVNHLWEVGIGGGAHAVVAFYIVSGFLITKVVNEVYGTDARGVAIFLANRFLRIFPAYWLFLGLTLGGLILFPIAFQQAYSLIRLPENGYDLFRNVTFVYLTWSPVIVIPPAWSLGVECVFYVAIGLGLSRSPRLALAWLSVSAAVTLWLVATGASFSERYHTTYAASLFFALGANVYHQRAILFRVSMPTWAGLSLLALFCVLPLMSDALGPPRGALGYYGAAALFLPILAWSFNHRPPRWRSADRWLGDLAYPVFLCHFFAAGVALTVAGTSIRYLSASFCLTAYALAVALALIYLRLAEPAIERVRDRVRAGACSQAPTASLASAT